jgi:hypothetical protein
MKKKLFLFFGLLGSLLVLSACSPQQKSQTPADGKSPAGNQQGDDRMRRPDFGQPDRPADIRGLVKSIVGNEATVLKLDMGANRASSTPENKSGSTTDKTARLSLGGSQAMRTGGPGGMGGAGRPGEQDSDTRAQMLAKLKEMSTGEEKIIIPVGIKMMKPSSDAASGRREMVEATLADVTSDKNIIVWLNASISDKKVADFVIIN